MEESEVKLQPGVAFRLQPDGQWKPEKLPPEVLKEAKFSGYLTIQGYRCSVFETPDKNQWAQKSTGTLASKIAARWLFGGSVHEILQRWKASPPAASTNEMVDDTYYMYVENANSIDGATGEETGSVWQLIHHTGDGEDYAVYTAAPDSFDPAQAEQAMHADAKPAKDTIAARIAARWLASDGMPPPPTTPAQKVPDPSTVKEDEYQHWKDADGKHVMFHRSNGKLWMTPGSEDPDSFDPNDAEEVSDDDADYAPAEMEFVKSGRMDGSVASKIAARWLQAQEDITSLVQKKLDRDGDDKDYDKAIVDFVTKTRTKLPTIDTALQKACDVLLNTREKVEHSHPKVNDRYVQMFLQELAQKHRELEDMRNQLMRGLTVELDRYESEANTIPEGHPEA